MRRKLWLILGLSTTVLLMTMTIPAVAITVISQVSNANITLGVAFSDAEFENPLGGLETVQGYRMLEWRDADFTAGSPNWYDDWNASDPTSIDGNDNEIWMRARGHSIWTKTTIPSTIVSIHLNGDNNDGLAEVVVDGTTVATLDMGTNGIDRAIIVVTALSNSTHQIMINDLGIGPSQMGTDIAAFGAAALTDVKLKWDQPPDPIHPTNIYYGWNEYSVSGGQNIAADDWACTTDDPVTDIHWWGSFLGWNKIEPPQIPDAFHVTIWTDVPSGQNNSFSHPGEVIWDHTYSTFTWEPAGWDFDPQTQEYETCFKFNLDLPKDDWFYQEVSATGEPNIYWISIAAVYKEPSQYPWGWKTRPRDLNSLAPDAAMRIFDPTSPAIGGYYEFGEPIFWPTDQESWDMAFELTSEKAGQGVKYDQPPFYDPDLKAYYGWDEKSIRGDTQIVADDFPCTDSRPITDIHWWGSYPGWLESTPPSDAPSAFQIGIWTDVPAGVTEWSHPGVMIWQYYVSRADANETFDGFDWYDGLIQDSCFKYDINLPMDQWFYQETGNNVYWVSIAAIYDTIHHFSWGWKTRPKQFNDNAVIVYKPTDPIPGNLFLSGLPINDAAGNSWDMSFRLTTQEDGESYIKWSQPPVSYDPQDTYNGWNEQSTEGGPQIVADDWLCRKPSPVTGINWWGSFLNWSENHEPPLPDAFHFTIWTDVPSGETGSFSHPGQVVWEYWSKDYSHEFVGWDIDPRNPDAAPEACFLFHQDIPKDIWFIQRGYDNIYWLGISAVYYNGISAYPWGWKTRPKQFQDDAVRIFDPLAPIIGSYYKQGEPIWWPEATQSWDTAFQLATIDIEVGGLTITYNRKIRDHFWRPTPLDPDNEMISLKIAADPTEPVRWNSITLQASGSGNDLTDISSVKVWQDNNGNGVVDAGDVSIGVGAYSADDGIVTIPITGMVISAGGSINAIVSYTMSGTGTNGNTYKFTVTATAGTGMISGWPVSITITPSPLVSAKKIRGPKPISIGRIKLLPVGSTVLLEGKFVTANFQPTMSLCYIEEEDRSAGIGVLMDPAPDETINITDKVSILGKTMLWPITTTGVELILAPIEGIVETGDTIYPVGMNNKWTGGGRFGEQPGVYDVLNILPSRPAYGLSNVGMLIRTCGRVTAVEPATAWTPPVPGSVFWIDDGSNLYDGIPSSSGDTHTGIAVLLPSGATMPTAGTYWSITGIMRAITVNGSLPIRLLCPRDSSDMTLYPETVR